MKIKMKALKAMRYRTKPMRAGKEFYCTRHAARVFTALRKAVQVPSDPAPAKPVKSEAFRDPLDDLRARYEALAGSAPDRRWGENRLRHEIEALEAVDPVDEMERDAEDDGSPDIVDG